MDAEDGEQLRITFEDYRKISNMLILHMREFEEKNKGIILGVLQAYFSIFEFNWSTQTTSDMI